VPPLVLVEDLELTVLRLSLFPNLRLLCFWGLVCSASLHIEKGINSLKPSPRKSSGHKT